MRSSFAWKCSTEAEAVKASGAKKLLELSEGSSMEEAACAAAATSLALMMGTESDAPTAELDEANACASKVKALQVELLVVAARDSGCSNG